MATIHIPVEYSRCCECNSRSDGQGNPPFYGTRSFITASTRDRHRTFWAARIHFSLRTPSLFSTIEVYLLSELSS